MSLLEEITANGKQRLITGLVTALILLVAIVAILHEAAGPPVAKTPARVWFYDLNTGNLFIA